MNVAIVQARMGSSRLPGKILADLAGRPVMAHVLARARAIAGIDRVCCALPVTVENDEAADTAAACGADVFRGSEHDVLSRYLGAAEVTGATVVMRITCDCPLLDPEVSAGVLALFLKGGLDYASCIGPRTWPQGLDTEVFSIAALQEAAAKATEPADREHVTPYMRREAHFKRASTRCDSGDYGAWRWTLDYPEDLAFARAVLARASSDLPGFNEIHAIVEAEPEIARLNAHLAHTQL
ncbi:MAG: glycosyltransferase family protein [Maricaulaceae bacterium]|jgi:spore coat polysaccharide biosynthesis protein SpsF (cytidylyltransferase family)